MAVMGNRAMGIMDYIDRIGGSLITPPQSSPVYRGRSPLEMAMNRPEVQFSQPNASTMATTMPSGSIATASPTPQVQSAMTGQAQGMPTPPRVTTVEDRPELNEEVRAQQSPLGQGQFTPEMLRKAQDASQIEEQVRRNPQLEQDPRFMDRVKDYFGSRENMVRLALAFNSMRLQPDAGLAAVLGDELKDIRTTATSRDMQNRTAQYFDNVDPEIARAIRGGLSAKDAIALYRDKQKGVVVGKKIINPYTAEVIYDGTEEGGDLPEAMKTLLARAKEAGLQPGTQEYQQFMINGGQRQGLSLKVGADGTVELTEGGVGGTTKAPTEAQGKATQFAERMANSQQIINSKEVEGTDIYNAIASNIPFAGNLLTSPEYKEYEQAKRDFINAILRYESGAAIGASEFESADKQYFPQPGDTPEVIAQKRKNRDIAIATMQAVSGPVGKQMSEAIRVQLFGPEAANWPDVGTIIDDPDNPGTKLKYRGGDPNIDSNWEVQ